MIAVQTCLRRAAGVRPIGSVSGRGAVILRGLGSGDRESTRSVSNNKAYEKQNDNARAWAPRPCDPQCLVRGARGPREYTVDLRATCCVGISNPPRIVWIVAKLSMLKFWFGLKSGVFLARPRFIRLRQETRRVQPSQLQATTRSSTGASMRVMDGPLLLVSKSKSRSTPHRSLIRLHQLSPQSYLTKTPLWNGSCPLKLQPLHQNKTHTNRDNG